MNLINRNYFITAVHMHCSKKYSRIHFIFY